MFVSGPGARGMGAGVDGWERSRGRPECEHVQPPVLAEVRGANPTVVPVGGYVLRRRLFY